MRMHRCVTLLLTLCVPFHVVYAQSPLSSLQQAERAFAAALVAHDRAAFVGLLASDAESTLPSAVRGPEAIAKAWLPFLIDPGTTMLLSSTDVAVGADGTSGSSAGTFAIRGRTAAGVQTIPAGTYALSWRLIGGRWKITAIAGTGRSGPPSTAPSSSPSDTPGRTPDSTPSSLPTAGTGSYRFGMTRDEVKQVSDCAPYTPVAVTGGLECPHYQFDGREMNISFLFGGDRLRRIQLWYYEGESRADAQDAVARIFAFFKRTAGGVTITDRPDLPTNEGAVLDALDRHPGLRSGQLLHVEICGPTSNGAERWFARVGRHQYGYGVMLFVEPAARR